MIELYAVSSPNVLKIMLMLEELGLDYTLRFVDLWTGEQYAESFLRLNPNAKVPVLVDRRGGEAVTIFESGAILIYLAETGGALLPRSVPDRYTVLQWLMIQLTGLGPMFGQYVHFQRYMKDAGYPRSRYLTEATRLVEVLDARLGETPWLGGDDYSIADVSTYPWMRNFSAMKLPAEHGNVDRWLAAIEARPATARFLARASELIAQSQTAMRAATPDGLDRFFGRGQYARG